MKRVLLGLIRFYRANLSRRVGYGYCRFTPTCSQYALDSIEAYGALRGSILMIWRILRCNPFGKSGYDPIPERYLGKEMKKGIRYHSFYYPENDIGSAKAESLNNQEKEI